MDGVQRIVFMGDSITANGSGPTGHIPLILQRLRERYPDRSFEILNAGMIGDRSTDMAARFDKDVVSQHPDLVVLSVGINDVYQFYVGSSDGQGQKGVPLDLFKANVEGMADRASAAGAKMLLFTTTIFEESPNSPMNQRITPYNNAIRAMARKRRLPLADQNKALWKAWSVNQQAGNDIKLTTDGIHPTPEGYAIMAQTTLEQLL
jgi:lysophospholipase L1-like esterase